jgi:hypothetical protein
MPELISLNATLPVVTHDGWADTAADNADRPIRGSLIKCNDGQWLRGKEATPLNGTCLAAVAVRDVWTKWSEGKPSEYLFREPGKNMAEREDLGDLDQEDWDVGPDGQKRDPWVQTKLLYLMDEKTAELLTYSTSTMGGRAAIGDLAEQIAVKRMGHPRAIPIVELGNATMRTKFGNKLRPHLQVIDWRNTVEPIGADGPRTETEKVFDDEIPF